MQKTKDTKMITQALMKKNNYVGNLAQNILICETCIDIVPFHQSALRGGGKAAAPLDSSHDWQPAPAGGVSCHTHWGPPPAYR